MKAGIDRLHCPDAAAMIDRNVGGILNHRLRSEQGRRQSFSRLHGCHVRPRFLNAVSAFDIVSRGVTASAAAHDIFRAGILCEELKGDGGTGPLTRPAIIDRTARLETNDAGWQVERQHRRRMRAQSKLDRFSPADIRRFPFEIGKPHRAAVGFDQRRLEPLGPIGHEPIAAVRDDEE
jgi:hypothetical protein